VPAPVPLVDPGVASGKERERADEEEEEEHCDSHSWIMATQLLL